MGQKVTVTSTSHYLVLKIFTRLWYVSQLHVNARDHHQFYYQSSKFLVAWADTWEPASFLRGTEALREWKRAQESEA